jgi:hypothetical protein
MAIKEIIGRVKSKLSINKNNLKIGFIVTFIKLNQLNLKIYFINIYKSS